MTIAFADRLCALRREHGLSQEELASRLGVSRQAVSKWERAEASPDTDNLIALAQLYAVSLDVLVGHEPSEGDAVGADRLAAVPAKEPAAPDQTVDGRSILPDTAADLAESTPFPASSADGRKSRWLTFPYPVLCTLVFLALGFAGGWWHPGWLVFLTVPLYYCLADIVVHRRPAKHFLYPALCLLVYMLLGCLGGWWHPGWLIFLTIPLYYGIVE